MKLPSRRARALSLAALLFLSACGGGAATVDEAATSAASTAQAGSDAVGDAPAVPASLLTGDFTTTTGETITLDNFQGQDVVLWYWAPW